MKKSSLIVLAVIIAGLQGCAAPKQLTATGGSRADGTIRLSYDYHMFEQPQVNWNQGLNVAQQRCAAWGYKAAEPFGGQTKTCINASGSGCNAWRVTVEYQCTDSKQSPRS